MDSKRIMRYYYKRIKKKVTKAYRHVAPKVTLYKMVIALYWCEFLLLYKDDSK